MIILGRGYLYSSQQNIDDDERSIEWMDDAREINCTKLITLVPQILFLHSRKSECYGVSFILRCSLPNEQHPN